MVSRSTVSHNMIALSTAQLKKKLLRHSLDVMTFQGKPAFFFSELAMIRHRESGISYNFRNTHYSKRTGVVRYRKGLTTKGCLAAIKINCV